MKILILMTNLPDSSHLRRTRESMSNSTNALKTQYRYRRTFNSYLSIPTANSAAGILGLLIFKKHSEHVSLITSTVACRKRRA